MDMQISYDIIFACITAVLAVYHCTRREYKIAGSTTITLGLAFIPAVLNTLFYINVDVFSRLVYFIILFMALYLGGSLRFYDKYKWWDRTIHFLSGIGFVGFGTAIARLSPDITRFVLLIFGFSFSVTLHVFWEVLEYLSDCIFRGNAQRWQLIHDSNNHKAEHAMQPAGLADTMNDMICCLIGAALMIVFGWSTGVS